MYWQGGNVCMPFNEWSSLEAIREKVKSSLKTLRQDHKRYLNPTPYKVRFGCFTFGIHPRNRF